MRRIVYILKNIYFKIKASFKIKKIGKNPIFFGEIETVNKRNIIFGSYLNFGRGLYFDASIGEIEIGNNCVLYDNIEIISQKKIHIGNNVSIGKHASLRAKNLHIGDDVWISRFVSIEGNNIHLSNGVIIGPNVQIISEVHKIDKETNHVTMEAGLSKPIKFEKGCWIGNGAIILPGVTIGEGSIVGAGSVVLKDVLKNSLYAGNPAEFKKSLINE